VFWAKTSRGIANIANAISNRMEPVVIFLFKSILHS